MFGFMVGAAGISQLSDSSCGRRIFLLSSWLYFLSSFFQVFAPNYVPFARFTVLYFGLSLYSTPLSGDRSPIFFLSGLVEISPYFAAALSMQKYTHSQNS